MKEEGEVEKDLEEVDVDLENDLQDFAQAANELECFGEEISIDSNQSSAPNLESSSSANKIEETRAKILTKSLEHLVIPLDDPRRKLASEFFKHFHCDDFKTAREFMEANCTADFVYIDHLKDGQKKLFPKVLEIHGIDNFMNFAITSSAAVPDRLFNLSNTVIRSTASTDCIMARVTFEATVTRDLRLSGTEQPVLVAENTIPPASLLVDPTKGVKSRKRKRKRDLTAKPKSINSSVREVSSFQPTFVSADVLTEKTIPESVPVGELSKEVDALVLPQSKDPFRFERGGALTKVHINYTGVVKFFLNSDRKIRRFEMIYVHNIAKKPPPSYLSDDDANEEQQQDYS